MSFDIANIGQIAARHNAQAMAENTVSNNGSSPKGKIVKFWVNFGAYSVVPETGERVFGSIGGMPLDTAPDRFLKSGNVAKAQASIHKDLMEIANELQPGEAVMMEAGPYAFEIRHIRGDEAQVSDGQALVADQERQRAKEAAIARVRAMRVAAS